MGFLNVDILLKEKITEFLTLLNGNEHYRVHEIFDSLSEAKKDDIFEYINKLTVTDNVQIRRENENFLYVVTSPILADGPFPQIGVYIGNESQSDRGLGDDTGEEPVEIIDGDTTFWENEYGLWQNGNWIIDIVGTTRDETVWLSRICQYAIALNFQDLDELGLKEMDMTLQDTALDPQFYPGLVFSRRITVRGKFPGTWKTRTAVTGTYETGINIAIEELP